MIIEQFYTSDNEVFVDSAGNELLVLSDEQKVEIVAIKEDDLIDLHFTLGLAIRNAFGLHDLGSKLIADCGVVHPDDASGVIIKELWKKLQEVDENTD